MGCSPVQTSLYWGNYNGCYHLLLPRNQQPPRTTAPLVTASLAAMLTSALFHDDVVVCFVLQDLQH